MYALVNTYICVVNCTQCVLVHGSLKIYTLFSHIVLWSSELCEIWPILEHYCISFKLLQIVIIWVPISSFPLGHRIENAHWQFRNSNSLYTTQSWLLNSSAIRWYKFFFLQSFVILLCANFKTYDTQIHVTKSLQSHQVNTLQYNRVLIKKNKYPSQIRSERHYNLAALVWICDYAVSFKPSKLVASKVHC